MKFKRILAVLLSALMLTSLASFTASAEETAELAADPILAYETATNQGKLTQNERGQASKAYDAINNVVFTHVVPAFEKTGSDNSMYLNMYGLPTAVKTTADTTELYAVCYMRTNQYNNKPYAGFYGGISGSNSARLEIVKSEEWVKQVYTIKIPEAKRGGESTHFWIRVIGDNTVNVVEEIDGKKVVTGKVIAEDAYYDVASVALFASLEDAEAYDVEAKNAYAGDATIYFDAQLTDDDDTDVFVEFPENLENDGNALLGWTLDPDADEIVYYNPTNLPVPEEDVTYYAVWSEERTYNFYKNDGTDTVETIVLGKGATIEAPEFTIENKKFLGWAETPDGEVVDIQTIADTSADYYAIWLNNWLTEVVVNSNDYSPSTKNGSWYGIEDLATAESLDFVMPYGYPTSIVPTIVPKAANGEAVYNAPATFDDEGSIVMGDITIPVTFTVADKDSVKDMTIVPEDTVNAGGRGAKAFKNNEDMGISALKVVPIYSTESEYFNEIKNDKDEVTGGYLPNKGTGVEGWGTFATHNIESYSQYRALIYYDDGGDEIDIDITKNPAYIGVSGAHTRGTFKGVNIFASNKYKTNRWEYVYFNIPDDKYGMTLQLSYYFFFGKNANAFKNDVLYVAEVSALVDADEKFLQYKPVGLTFTNETSAKNDGTIKGVTSDMEIAIGDGEYALATTFEGYDADMCVLGGLAPATYFVRYAGDDAYAASEAVELLVAPDSVEIYYDDGNDSTGLIEQKYDYDADIVLPEDPTKAGYKFAGWALDDSEEAYDFTDAKATSDLDGVTFKAIWERITTIYVNGSAPASGDGYTAETALTSLADAWALVSDVDSTIIITGNTDLKGNLHANGGNVTIKGVTGEEILTHAGPSFKGTNPGKITFENLTIINPTQWSNFWNFYGMEVEFGEGITVPVDKANGKWAIVARAGGESGATLGRKIVLKSGEFSTFHLGSKGNVVNADVDFELLGGKATINLGNDSVANQQVTTHGGTMQNIKARFEVQPGNVYMQWIHTMTGALQVIANNGVSIDKIEMNGVVPQGGTWKILSAEGGRADFTDTIGTYKFTTDATYVVITDAEGNSTKYRMADGATGDANLYGEEASLELALPAGTYNVAYTNEGVSVKVAFVDPNENVEVELNAGNDYTATIPEAVISKAEQGASEGYKFSGEFASKDGKYTTVDGAITVTEYTAETIALYPVYVEDDSLAYYHAKAIYNDKNGTLDVTVSIANGKFTAGTVGGMFEKDVLAFADYTLADGISNNLGDAPEIVKDAMYDGENDKFVLVWDAMAGNVDATAGDVEIVTFHFDVLDAEAVTADNIRDVVFFWWPDNNYEGYYEDGYYQASPVLAEGEDEFAVNYVDVYTGEVEFELAPTDPATLTVTVNMPDKAGATIDNIAYLAYTKDKINWTFIALEEAGNEEATIEKTISDVFFVGETYEFVIVKNGYTGTDIKTITVESGMVLEATLDGGDIKESFTGVDENAVDIEDFGEGLVTLADFVRVVRAFDAAATDEYKAVVDINEDGVVNVTDLNIVKANYGKSYEECVITVTTADGE